MPEYTLSGEALTEVLLGPQPDPWRQSHDSSARFPETLAQVILTRAALLQELKTVLPAEVHGVLDEQAEVNVTPRPARDVPPRPPGSPGPWPPPSWQRGPRDLAVLAAHSLSAASLHPAVAEQGQALMHRAVRQLNTGHR